MQKNASLTTALAHFLRNDCFYWPACGDERQAIHAGQDREGGYQADLVGHRSNADGERDLQEGSGKIERILYAPHQMFGNHFHQAGVHRDAANAAA